MTVTHDYKGRTVLVTGGTKGIGAGIAAAFRQAGADVVVCARKDPGPLPDGIRFVQCDVRDPEQVAALVGGLDRLDVVVNNAGGGPYAPAADASPRLHQRIIELNLLAPLHVAQAAYHRMKDHGGSIIMIGSVSGTRPSPGTAAYGAAKAGLHHLAACLAAEWAPAIRVNSIVVGLIATGEPGQEEHYGGPAVFGAIARTVPAGRLASPDDVARACLYLGDEPYMTGSTLTVDGGGEQPAWSYLVAEEHS